MKIRNTRNLSTSKQEFTGQCVPAGIDVYLLEITGYWKIEFVLNNQFELTTTMYLNCYFTFSQYFIEENFNKRERIQISFALLKVL